MSVRVLRFLGASVLLASCGNVDGPAIENERLASIETRLRVEEERLKAVQRDIAASEARAEAAREEANFQSCRAQSMELRAETERRRAQCAKAVADRNLCAARNSERTATNGIIGCGLGIVAATVTGGTAAPWALGGCGAGLSVGALSEDQCPSAECASTLDNLEAEVLAERQLAAPPRCGGYIGLELESERATAAYGLVVDEVNPGTYADSASMAAGDLLLSVNDRLIVEHDDVQGALRTVEEGSPLRVDVVRDGALFELSSQASRRLGNGKLSKSLLLGVKLKKPTTRASYVAGVVVATVRSDSPAARAGVRAGDVVKGIGSANDPAAMQGVSRVADVESFLGDKRASQYITLSLARGPETPVAEIQLAHRQARTDL